VRGRELRAREALEVEHVERLGGGVDERVLACKGAQRRCEAGDDRRGKQ
jgi:hypothetical protein